MKLEWLEVHGFHRAYAVKRAITILVKRFEGMSKWAETEREYNPKDYIGKWEVVIGNYYYSRAKGKFFDDADMAKGVAERLTLIVGKTLVELLN